VHRALTDGRGHLPRIGAVVPGSAPSLPWLVVDGAGREVEPVSSYLRDRMLGDVSPLTCLANWSLTGVPRPAGWNARQPAVGTSPAAPRSYEIWRPGWQVGGLMATLGW